MKVIFLLFLLFGASKLCVQTIMSKEISVKGEIILAEGISIPKINQRYTVWLPDTEAIDGLIVFTHARRDTVNRDPIIDYALSKQLAILYGTTGNRFEFFFENERLQEIENYIQEVVSMYHIADSNMLYCGMSLEGTRALKLAMFGQSSESRYGLEPKAIAICDAPLDMVWFHKEMVKAKKLNFTPITAIEGTWVSGYLERNLGGTPEDNLIAYINYSPYCYSANGGPNLDALTNIAIRWYTEPDVNW